MVVSPTLLSFCPCSLPCWCLCVYRPPLSCVPTLATQRPLTQMRSHAHTQSAHTQHTDTNHKHASNTQSHARTHTCTHPHVRAPARPSARPSLRQSVRLVWRATLPAPRSAVFSWSVLACHDVLRPCVSQDGWTAVYVALHNGHAPCIEVLLRAGADISTQDEVRAVTTPRADWFGATWLIDGCASLCSHLSSRFCVPPRFS